MVTSSPPSTLEYKSINDVLVSTSNLLVHISIAFYEGGVDEIISTRRLVHIVEAFSIFIDKMKAIELCTNRFELDTKTSFLDLYTKVDGGKDISTWGNPVEEEMNSDDSEEGNIDY